MSEATCDIAIIGGGPAGAAMAVALRDQAPFLSVTLIERTAYDTPRSGETLSPEVRLPLSRLGVWGSFLRDGHLASRGTASCWSRPEPSTQDTHMSPWGSAWHLDRARFDERLSLEATRLGVQMLRLTTLLDSERLGKDGYRLHLSQRKAGATTLRARFVVDATGWKATFAMSQGARRRVRDRCIAVYGTFQRRTGEPFPTEALVESCPEGWWHSALLPNGRVAVALVGDGDSLHGLRWATPQPWMALLDQAPATQARLAVCDFAGESLVAAPILVGQLDAMHGERWVAVGDAACTQDPLSAQGVASAMDSALLAAGAVGQYLRGDSEALRDYEATLQRRFEDHLRLRGHAYREEQRWRDAPFWKNRHEAFPAPPTAHQQHSTPGGLPT
ncbi:Tryptophan halogenase [Myxococcus hansupus]|uniref:Tryptophan halogenase n=1 Tax=Pseudomyxococcus hansupus TaxID=1297742 RepID=A0A0H4X1P3_9BACT|nr:tryptophan 7-halogenase [Myxococcus hansupus]AKQ69064.1 Tryptophan halogenase [Myxococcus hansupus]